MMVLYYTYKGGIPVSKQKSVYEKMRDNILRNEHTNIKIIVPPKSNSMKEVERLGNKLAHKAERIFSTQGKCVVSK